MQEEAAAAAEKVRQEDAIVDQAHSIHERRNMKQLPAFPEPKRGKTHWDHVLEEMNWMAKEFFKYEHHRTLFFTDSYMMVSPMKCVAEQSASINITQIVADRLLHDGQSILDHNASWPVS